MCDFTEEKSNNTRDDGPKTPFCPVVIMASGTSARFQDGNKLLAPFHGRPLILSSVSTVLEVYRKRKEPVLLMTREAEICRLLAEAYPDICESFQLSKEAFLALCSSESAERSELCSKPEKSPARSRSFISGPTDDARPLKLILWPGGPQSETMKLALRLLPYFTGDRLADGCLFVAADQPLLQAEDLSGLLEVFHSERNRLVENTAFDSNSLKPQKDSRKMLPVIRLSRCSRPGNPVLWPSVYFSRLLRIEGDRGGSALLKKGELPVHLVEAASAASMADVDTTEDLLRLSSPASSSAILSGESASATEATSKSTPGQRCINSSQNDQRTGIPQVSLAELLNIQRGITSIIGSGGKTTLLEKLADELRAKPAKIVLTTTTHILPFEGFPLILCTGDGKADLAEVIHALQSHDVLCVGTASRSLITSSITKTSNQSAAASDLYAIDATTGQIKANTQKLSAPSFPLKELLPYADYILTEADGSKRLPLKAHTAHEPVIPEGSNQTICVAGASGLGKPLSSVCHRPELFCTRSGLIPAAASLCKTRTENCSDEESFPVTAEMLAAVLAEERLADRYFINQCELLSTEDRDHLLSVLRSCLRAPVIGGSLLHGTLYH